MLHTYSPPPRNFEFENTINSKVINGLMEHSSAEIIDKHFNFDRAHQIWNELETVFGPTNTTLRMLAGNRLSRQRWLPNENGANYENIMAVCCIDFA